MSTPFTGSIVGSWLIVRSTKPDFDRSEIYHFDSLGRNYWEIEWSLGVGVRILTSLSYTCGNSTLTLKYNARTTRDFPLLKECDGTVRFLGVDGHTWWWMRRLRYPMDYSIAFIGDDGLLKRSLLAYVEY